MSWVGTWFEFYVGAQEARERRLAEGGGEMSVTEGIAIALEAGRAAAAVAHGISKM